MTVKDQDGKVVFSETKEYALYDLHYPEYNKEGYLGLNDWDITAMYRSNFGVEPFEVDSKKYVIPLPEGTKAVDIKASFRFLYEKDKEAVWNSVTKRLEF